MRIPAFVRRLGVRAVDISVRKHMLFYFLFLGLILIALMTWFFTSKMMESRTEKNLETTSNLVQYMGSTLESRLDGAMRAADLTMQQENILEMMEYTTSRKTYPMKQQLEDEKEVTDFLTRLEYSNNLVRVRLLLNGSPIYINENIHYFPLTDDIIEKATRGHYTTHWIEAHEFPYIYQNTQWVISVYRPVRGMQNYDILAGVVAVDIALSEVRDTLKNALDGDGVAIALVNEDGGRVTAVGETGLLPPSCDVYDVWDFRSDERLFSYGVKLADWGWTLIYACTEEKIIGENSAFLLDVMSGVAVLMAFCCLLSILSSSLTTRRIRRLASVMAGVQDGQMQLRVPEGGSNELGLLERSFNSLLDTLDATVESKIQDSLALQKTEVRLLHAQIQPHFLYNTLDLVNWRLMQAGDQKGSELVKKLARFYKLGLSHGKDQIPLRDELEHARLYAEIQAFRLGDFVDVFFDAPEDILHLCVTGNILQPLIENSIQHGIRGKIDYRGLIRVKACREGTGLLITVEDNGVGVDVHQMEQLIASDTTINHYGVWSIHKRLQLTYGPNAGLTYRNAPGGGTIVEVRLG